MVNYTRISPYCAALSSSTFLLPNSGIDSEAKRSKKELPKRPLFLVRVKSLVCTGEMIGPSRSGAGRDALPRVRRSMSRRFFWCFSRCAQARWAKRPALLLENRAKRDASPSLDLLRRIARERVPTIGRAAPDRLPSQTASH